jgi:hypothetical protein
MRLRSQSWVAVWERALQAYRRTRAKALRQNRMVEQKGSKSGASCKRRQGRGKG